MKHPNRRALPVLRGRVSVVMPFDAQAVFANLAEKEKLKGHHSAEGRTIRTLSRALKGWSDGNLSGQDVIVLCDQAVEDWLKARLKRSPWSERSFPMLLEEAVRKNVFGRIEAVRLQKIRHLRAAGRKDRSSAPEIEAVLEFCIELVDKRW